MKAVILIGGEATRLRPLTWNTPKAIVPVLNVPFLELLLRYLSQHQVKDIILTQSSSSPIEDHFGDGSQFGVTLSYTTEGKPLGTAGAVKNAERFLDKTFLVLNGDIFTDLDLTAMIDHHRQKKAKVTIALTPVDDPSSYGLVETDPANRVTRFLEKPTPDQITTNMINAGIYALEPDILTLIPAQTSVSIEREIFPLLLDQNTPVYAYLSSDYWIDIGTPQKYLQLNQDLLYRKKSTERNGVTRENSVLVGERSHLHPRAQIKEWAVIGPDCEIQEGAIVERSVIWRGVQVGRRSKVIDSIVANQCRIHDDALIKEAVLGDKVIVTQGSKLALGDKIEPGTTV